MLQKSESFDHMLSLCCIWNFSVTSTKNLVYKSSIIIAPAEDTEAKNNTKNSQCGFFQKCLVDMNFEWYSRSNLLQIPR